MPRAEIQGHRDWEERRGCGQEAGGWARSPYAMDGVAGHTQLPPRGCGAVPISAYQSSSSLTRTEERCREVSGGELAHFTCRVILGLSSHRSSRTLQIPPPQLPRVSGPWAEQYGRAGVPGGLDVNKHSQFEVPPRYVISLPI